MSEFDDLIERYCPSAGRNVAVKYDSKKNTWQCLEKSGCNLENCYHSDEENIENDEEWAG